MGFVEVGCERHWFHVWLRDVNADGLARCSVVSLHTISKAGVGFNDLLGLVCEVIKDLGLVVRENVDVNAGSFGTTDEAHHPIKELILVVEIKLLLVPNEYFVLLTWIDRVDSRFEAVPLFTLGKNTTWLVLHTLKGFEDLSSLVFAHWHCIPKSTI